MDCPAGEFDALLENDKEAEVLPLDCGVKVTVKDADWPAGMLAGSEIPESANSLLLRPADVTVIAVPLAVRLLFSDELDPTATLPNVRLSGDTANWPTAVPVPESAILSGESDAFETTDRLPLAALALPGVKIAVNVTLAFAFSVRGKVNPVIWKADPVKLACEMVTPDPPVLVSVSDKLVLFPT